MSSPGPFPSVIPLQIRFNDIDGQQHVNNAVYQMYYDIGRAGYFSAATGQEYQPGGRSLVIASITTDFLIPVFLHDAVQVETRVLKIGTKSLTMAQRITDRENGAIKSTCTTVFAGFDYGSQTTMPIDPDLRRAIAVFEDKTFPEK